MNQAKTFEFISESDVAKVLSAKDSNKLVENCFQHFDDPGAVQMPPKIYLTLPKGDFRAMPVYTKLGGSLVGIKWICVFPDNAVKKLPSVIGNILLNDTGTGRMLALIQANTITAYRTGSAGAVASRYLAIRKPQELTLVGAGVQSEYQLKCHLEFFDLKRVTVWSPFPEEIDRFVKRAHGLFPKIKGETDLRIAVQDADIICTCTPSRKPLIKAAWVKPGCHINAIGADAPGKRELETALLKKALIYVDDWEQASHSGEINVPVSQGHIGREDIAGNLTLALTRRWGRRSASDITVFDSTGLAIQDIVLAGHIYKKHLRLK